MRKVNDRKGEKFITKQGCKVEVIEYFNGENCTVKFEDGTILYNRRFREKNLKNPNTPSVYNVGYVGIGEYQPNKYKYIYNKWTTMLSRCYSENYQQKHLTYKDVTVCEEWYNFQNFAKWFKENYNPEVMRGWHLDKDILVKGNKIYSPETCCFVPQEINTMFFKKIRLNNIAKGVRYIKKTGKFVATYDSKYIGTYDTEEEAFQAYRAVKESYIKELAHKYKSQISNVCFCTMLNYKVEIDD